MIIKTSDESIREARLAAELTKAGSDDQVWKIKPFCDAAEYGLEIIWPYDDFMFSLPMQHTILPEPFLINHFLEVELKTIAKIPDGHSLMIMPHHTAFEYLNSPNQCPDPVAVTQMIESDWWPKPIKLLFAIRDCTFKKGRPCAQAVIVPRKEYSIKSLTKEEKTHLLKANEFLETQGGKYITRTAKTDLSSIDNLYERLSVLNRSNRLPEEIKEDKSTPSPRVRWR